MKDNVCMRRAGLRLIDSKSTLIKPRLYLDLPGIIIATNPPFKETRPYKERRYAPEVCQRLGSTGLELVWLTNWQQDEVHAAEAALGLAGRYLGAAEQPGKSKKVKALIADYHVRPAPFMWLSVRTTEGQKQQITEATAELTYTLNPNPAHGLNNAQLQAIELFARQHHSHS